MCRRIPQTVYVTIKIPGCKIPFYYEIVNYHIAIKHFLKLRTSERSFMNFDVCDRKKVFLFQRNFFFKC